MIKKLLLILFLLSTAQAKAVWLDVAGEVESLTTYATNNTVIVKLTQSGTTVEECANTTHFVISRDITAEARARMYSMLLAAKTAGTTVVISYNDSGNCESWGSDSNRYRKITRLR